MLHKYGLKIAEYGFYALAGLSSLPLMNSAWRQPYQPDDIIGVVFVLIGVGVLLPRAIAYKRWPKVLVDVGPYRNTWDGEQSASYTYKVGNQSYSGTFGSARGNEKLTKLVLCVNPDAPWMRYPVLWNIWYFGLILSAIGVFFIVSEKSFLG